VVRTSIAAATLVLILAGCASVPIEQRTTHGPTAEDVYVARIYAQNGRAPNFEERSLWRDQLDRQIQRYLYEHPQLANSEEAQSFRFTKQVTVGMTQEQASILLGPPVSKVADAAALEKLARRYWPDIKGKATEAWTYPGGWNVFIGDGRVVDITQFVEKPPLLRK
jgi:hypothetical protein